MRSIDQKESEEWLSLRGLNFANRYDLLSSDEKFMVMKPDSAVKAAPARKVVHTFFTGGTSLIFVSLHGVFPSCEIPFLFEEFRSRHSFGGTIVERPGTFVSMDETSYLISLLALALYFLWDVAVVDEDTTVLFFASHDGEYTVNALNEAMEPEIGEFIYAQKTRI